MDDSTSAWISELKSRLAAIEPVGGNPWTIAVAIGEHRFRVVHEGERLFIAEPDGPSDGELSASVETAQALRSGALHFQDAFLGGAVVWRGPHNIAIEAAEVLSAVLTQNLDKLA